MSNTQTKKLTIGALATVIVLSWGYAGYNYFNPPTYYVDGGDLIDAENIISAMCPYLSEEFTSNVVEGKMEGEFAEGILTQCTRDMQNRLFERALVEEFANQKHRQ